METPQPSWSTGIEKPLFKATSSTGLRSALSGVFPLMETMEQETREPSQTASSPTDDRSTSIRDLFQIIYQNLHQRHYLDAIVHALYIVPDGPFVVKPNRLGRESSFIGQIRVAYPQPDELLALIKQVENDSRQDMTLLSLILTKPLLRFRLCAVAHLLEVVFAEVEKVWLTSERPRILTGDDMTFVMETLQGFFLDLLQDPRTQTILRAFFTDVYLWLVRCMAEENADNIALPNLPNVVKNIFPCHVAILNELRPILIHCKSDPSFQGLASNVFKFIMLSLGERDFVLARDWITVGLQHFEEFQKALSGMPYHRFAQSLIRNIVSMTDQLWESGRAVDTALAIEKCLTGVLGQTLVGSGAHSNQETDASPSWEEPSTCPLPTVSWTRGDSHMCLDSMVVQFSNIIPSDIKLESTLMIDNRTNNRGPQWLFKMRGLEMVAKDVPYNFVVKSPFLGNTVDNGTLSMMIPENSLEIEVIFTVTPGVRHGETGGRNPTQDQGAGTHPGTSTGHASISVSATSSRRPSQSTVSYQSLSSSGEQDQQTSDRILWGRPRLMVHNSISTHLPSASEHGKFVEVEKCKVTLSKLDVQARDIKNPSRVRTSGSLVNQLRVAVEQAFKQMIMDAVDTINTNVEELLKR
ncbi:MAG: hypothetical protein J3Q66DRAFT_323400 [Benniella sp.]|nr:MAG: hypothetical protein J3Q66DRAFT_323400 [Benniella sp.]